MLAEGHDRLAGRGPVRWRKRDRFNRSIFIPRRTEVNEFPVLMTSDHADDEPVRHIGAESAPSQLRVFAMIRDPLL